MMAYILNMNIHVTIKYFKQKHQRLKFELSDMHHLLLLIRSLATSDTITDRRPLAHIQNKTEILNPGSYYYFIFLVIGAQCLNLLPTLSQGSLKYRCCIVWIIVTTINLLLIWYHLHMPKSCHYRKSRHFKIGGTSVSEHTLTLARHLSRHLSNTPSPC